MSRAPLLLLLLLLASGVEEPLVFAEGATLASAELPFIPSAAPALLDPILSTGRTDWHCEPELAASSAQVREARLPNALAN
ncbi:MAG TPA: hypothetical protein VFE16_07675 [Candidatus Cybelea sp.]|nr:hypothetical protein [Candidatus Cybelea sp.]